MNCPMNTKNAGLESLPPVPDAFLRECKYRAARVAAAQADLQGRSGRILRADERDEDPAGPVILFADALRNFEVR
jgi:hypothetical protein